MQELKAYKLSPNVKKTKLLIFEAKDKKIKQQVDISLDGSGIKQVESARFLRVHIDENINWKNHISPVCSKISKLSGILSRARHYLPHAVMRGLYYALINPRLSYGNILWANTYTIRLEPTRRLQKKIIASLLF